MWYYVLHIFSKTMVILQLSCVLICFSPWISTQFFLSYKTREVYALNKRNFLFWALFNFSFWSFHYLADNPSLSSCNKTTKLHTKLETEEDGEKLLLVRILQWQECSKGWKQEIWAKHKIVVILYKHKRIIITLSLIFFNQNFHPIK